MSILIAVFGSVVVVVCLVIILVNMKEKDKEITWKQAWPVFVAVVGLMIVFHATQKAGEEEVENIISKEVKLENVGVRGKYNFVTQIRIEYANGKLENIILIPNTTVQIPVEK